MLRTSILLLLLPTSLLAQTAPPPPNQEVPPHDISKVDTVPPDGAIAVPLTGGERRRMQKYDIPELVGSRQALGSQLIDGELPKPILDYLARNGRIEERLSLFEGGLVVVNVTGAGATIKKKLIIPPDAVKNYLNVISTKSLSAIREGELVSPRQGRKAFLRIYEWKEGKSTITERAYDPVAMLPKTMNDQVLPLQDLMRAIYEDRGITNTVAGYIPKVGDELVADDRRVYKVLRVVEDRIVELKCQSDPTMMYVAIKDLYNYFIGTTGAARQ